MQGLELTPETAARTFDLFRLLFTIGWGLVIIIIYFHASYNEQGSIFWMLFALVIPGVGFLMMDKFLKGRSEFLLILPMVVFIAYFLFYYAAGVERAARRARVHAEQHWEFALTDKGRRKDPNVPEGEPDSEKQPHHGHRPEVLLESPPSREVEELAHEGHVKDIIDVSPPSRAIEHQKKPPQSPPHLKKVIDESPPSRDIGGKPGKK